MWITTAAPASSTLLSGTALPGQHGREVETLAVISQHNHKIGNMVVLQFIVVSERDVEAEVSEHSPSKMHSGETCGRTNILHIINS